MPWNDLSSSLINNFNHKTTKILNTFEKEANLYLQESPNFKGPIDDQTDHKNDLVREYDFVFDNKIGCTQSRKDLLCSS